MNAKKLLTACSINSFIMKGNVHVCVFVFVFVCACVDTFVCGYLRTDKLPIPISLMCLL